ncbi:MAG: hypothetical protein VZR56_07195 [Treponema sp.]|nr:hypothetical protein [Treponema sp.]
MDGKKGKMEHRLNIKKSLRNDYALGMDTRYYYAAQEWKKHFALFKNHQTQFFEEGDEVILLIKPESPKSALILDLYFD